jgi:hypothetical protein
MLKHFNSKFCSLPTSILCRQKNFFDESSSGLVVCAYSCNCKSTNIWRILKQIKQIILKYSASVNNIVTSCVDKSGNSDDSFVL